MGLTISQLSAVTALATGDQIVVWSSSNGDTRKASLTTLLAFFEDQFAAPGFETQTNAPTSSGFNLQLTASTESIWAVVNPTGAFAAGTITLPAMASSFDGQQILVTCSDSITALTVAGNGAVVIGAPTSLGVGGFFALRYNESQASWYCTSQSLGSTDVFDSITISTSVLDANGYETITFAQEGVGAAVNNVLIFNSTTGNETGVAAVGSDTDIDLALNSKGAGVVRIDGLEAVGTTGVQQLLDKTIVDGDLQNCSVSDGALTWVTTTVAGLGAATTIGVRKFVTDSNAAMTAGIGAVVAGGGANKVPVFSDGTNWRIG